MQPNILGKQELCWSMFMENIFSSGWKSLKNLFFLTRSRRTSFSCISYLSKCDNNTTNISRVLQSWLLLTPPVSSCSLRGRAWRSVWRRTTVCSFWWLPTQFPCGSGWTSSSRRQTSTADTDVFHVWLWSARADADLPLGLIPNLLHTNLWMNVHRFEMLEHRRKQLLTEWRWRAHQLQTKRRRRRRKSSITHQLVHWASVPGRFYSLSCASPCWLQSIITGLIHYRRTHYSRSGRSNTNKHTLVSVVGLLYIKQECPLPLCILR